jgi:raffinose/stachyose/melibiose transport system permease protein
MGMKKNNTMTLIAGVILILVTLVILYPLIFLLFTSFKTNAEFLTNLFGLPKVFKWSNYTDAWSGGGISLYFLNSVMVSGASVVLTLILAVLGGYALAKMHIPKSEMIVLAFLAFIFISGYRLSWFPEYSKFD